MVEYPELATAAGFPGQNRRWSDDSPAGIEARKKHLHESAAALKVFRVTLCLVRNSLISICIPICSTLPKKACSMATTRCRSAT